MVTVIDYKGIEKEDGEKFMLLILQGGVEAVRSEKTGKMYFTARTAKVPATFDEDTCKDLIGTKFDGTIKKVKCEPYEYEIRETQEIISLDYRFEYVTELEEIIDEHLVSEEEVQ
jgi:hypothetical protein